MSEKTTKKIKCLIFDLDNTLWQGTLLEDQNVTLKAGVKEIIQELDQRGILLSIASKNDFTCAMEKLSELGLQEYFLYPQINWNSKVKSIETIAQALNLGLDSFAFIDDQAFEREEVAFAHPQVLTIDAEEYVQLLEMPELQPPFLTEDSRLRRQMYRSDEQRKAAEEEFSGAEEEFLKTLHMNLTISPVQEGDLERVEELTVRTNQLNSTGTIYDFETLRALSESPQHIFLIASLNDRFGNYGKIGLMLLEDTTEALEIRLLLMSCRVMTRGIGSALLIHAIKLAETRHKKLRAEFIDTGKNRIMYITYKMMGFMEIAEKENWSLLEYCGVQQREYPEHLQVRQLEKEKQQITISEKEGSSKMFSYENTTLIDIFTKIYISIVKVNLQTGIASVLKSDSDPQAIGIEHQWQQLLESFIERRMFAEDQQKVREAFTLERLKRLIEYNDEPVALEIRCYTKQNTLDWIEICLSVISQKEQTLLITTQNINEHRLLKNIVNRFVYSNFDYFILIDLPHNSYKTFGKNHNGNPVPADYSDDYTADMIRFNQQYVIPEDVDWVTNCMSIEHIRKRLNEEEEYSFTCSSLTKEGNFRKSRVLFTYYDRTLGLVITARTDITQIYMEEKKKNEQLLSALREAQVDALTGLYNQKKIHDLASNILESRRKLSSKNQRNIAFLFVDIDNFKLVNDTLGHLKGNELIQFTARSLSSFVTKHDLVGRVGGDEFLLVLPEISNRCQIIEVADKICRLFTQENNILNEQGSSTLQGDIAAVKISCSVGISVFPNDGVEYDTLVSKADQALYNAKRYGKSTHAFYSALTL